MSERPDLESDPDAWAMPAGSLDRWPEDYEHGRPGWQPETVDTLGLPTTATVLELGAGTGKLTRVLTSCFDRVIAVEPSDAMRRILTNLCPQAEALQGSAEEIPLEDESVDAVFTAEAFHRFDSKRPVAEITRVLRPRGVLALMWNLPATPWEPTIEAVEQLLNKHVPNGGRLGYDPFDLGSAAFTSGEWRRAFNESPFEEFQARRISNPQLLNRDGLVAFFASMGWIADLPDAERLPLLDEVRSRLTTDAYRRVWETHLHWTRL